MKNPKKPLHAYRIGTDGGFHHVPNRDTLLSYQGLGDLLPLFYFSLLMLVKQSAAPVTVHKPLEEAPSQTDSQSSKSRLPPSVKWKLTQVKRKLTAINLSIRSKNRPHQKQPRLQSSTDSNVNSTTQQNIIALVAIDTREGEHVRSTNQSDTLSIVLPIIFIYQQTAWGFVGKI